MFARILAVCSTVVALTAAYLFIWIGNMAHVRFGAIKVMPEGEGDFIKILLLLSITICFLGIAAWIGLIFRFATEAEKKESDYRIVALAAFAFFSICFFFGLFELPITIYGVYPWQWASNWEVIPALAGVPLLVAMVHRKKKTLPSQGTPSL